MHPIEIETALQNLCILVDTREQDTEQSKRRYNSFGCPFEREKLDFGDYSAKCVSINGLQIDLRQVCAIERKMSLDELCACYTHDRKRFSAEFERAKELGAKIYLLVEGASWELIYNGRYRSKMIPKALIASVLAWLARYDCQLIFCKAETSGKLIYDILYREMKEYLNNITEGEKVENNA